MPFAAASRWGAFAVLVLVLSGRAQSLSERFYAFDNGTGRDQRLAFDQQAALLAKTGYAGMGIYTGTARIPEMLAALDARQLPLLSVYVHSYVDGRAEPLDRGIAQAVRDLAGRDTMLLLTVKGRGPDGEQRAVQNVQRAADLAAAYKLRVCLYPHIDFHIETTADALRIARKAARPNVGVALNLYHTVAFHRQRCGSEDFDMAGLINAAGRNLWLVSINGIRREPGGATSLERLDRGDYDVGRFLTLLDRAGYNGPVALQSYGVKGDLEENLAHSMESWRSLVKRVQAGR